jgi:hypothetical protein
MPPLAQSKNYKVEHEYETVILSAKDNRKIVIGDFYGDPAVAIIDRDERWCAVGGCGLIVYWLEEPFAAYRYRHSSPQYFELRRYQPDIWWIESIEQGGPSEIKIRLADEATYQISFDRSVDKTVPTIKPSK